MDRLLELLAGLDAESIDLTDDDLDTREHDLTEAAREIRESGDLSDEAIAAATQIRDAVVRIQETRATRAAERAEREAQMAELLGDLNPGPEDEPEEETPEAEEPEGEPVEAETVEPEVEAIAASAAEDAVTVTDTTTVTNVIAPPARVPLGRMAASRPSEMARPPASTGPRLVAAADLPDRSPGSDLGGWDGAADAMIERVRSFMGAEHQGSPQKIRVGSERWEYPAGRVLTASADENYRLAMEAIGANPTPNSLTAAGICGPADVRYQIDGLGDAGRPLRDGLPSFGAGRGGINFRRPLGLSNVVVNDTAGAIDTITNADPNQTKTVQTIACATNVEVNVQAITERLQFDNWMELFDPDRMRDAIDTARVAHARTAERALLALIDAGSTQVNGVATGLGFIRNLVSHVVSVSTRFRFRHRMASTATMRVILPEWFRDATIIDTVNQHAGDDLLTRDPGDLITSLLGRANVVPIWQRDELTATTMDDAQAAGLATDFPQNTEVFIFPEGTWLFLDGGQLDFGIVRDSTLNNTNELQTFFETFESVARIGIESIALSVPVCASGAGALDIAADCGGIGS